VRASRTSLVYAETLAQSPSRASLHHRHHSSLFLFFFLPSRGVLDDSRRLDPHEGVSLSPRGQGVTSPVSRATPIAKAPSVWNNTFNKSSIGETYAVRSREGIFLQVKRKILSLPHGVS
jgi:hypothetical protein